MNWILIVLPSGADTTRSVRIVSPAEGATVSSSKASSIAAIAAFCFLPDSLFAAASISSRLATSPVAVNTPRLPNTALRRGSMRGSSASFEAIAFYSRVALLVKDECTKVRFLHKLSMREFDQHLGAGAGPPQRLEHLGHLLDLDDVGDHRLRLDPAARQRLDGLVKIGGVIAEREIHADFLEDALNRLNFVGLHADPDNHDLPARSDHADRVAERALDPDAFEDQLGRAPG